MTPPLILTEGDLLGPATACLFHKNNNVHYISDNGIAQQIMGQCPAALTSIGSFYAAEYE